jgi:hypothetical protein
MAIRSYLQIRRDYKCSQRQNGKEICTVLHCIENEKSDKLDSYKVKENKATLNRIWQAGGGFDSNIWNPEVVHHSINYIEANPVRKKLSIAPETYKWSSEYPRVNDKGVIPDVFNMPVKMINY